MIVPRARLVDSSSERALDLVRRHGFNATSFQTLAPGYSYHFESDACVAYVDTGSAWIAAGAPFADETRLGREAASFLAAAKRARRRVAWFGVEERFLHATRDLVDAVFVGEQPVWDPSLWSALVANHPSLERQLTRARNKHVVVRDVTRDDLESSAYRQRIDELVRRWRTRHRMPRMKFLVELAPFELEEHRTSFVARRGSDIVGWASLLPVPKRRGFFLEHWIRDPDAPNGTMELLVDHAFRHAAARGGRFVTLGLAPLSGAIPEVLAWMRRRFSFLYDFEGLYAFKSKFRPHAWIPLHVAYPRGGSTTVALLDTLRAFSGEDFTTFGARTLQRFAARAERGRRVS